MYDNIHIDIEINCSNFEKIRNGLYCDKLYIILLEISKKASLLKKFIYIN